MNTNENSNIWAPWRMEYLDSLRELQSGCFFCNYRDNPDKDEENLVLVRGKRVFSMLNRFPYTGGHTLVSPYEHVADIDDIDEETSHELMDMIKMMDQMTRTQKKRVLTMKKRKLKRSLLIQKRKKRRRKNSSTKHILQKDRCLTGAGPF